MLLESLILFVLSLFKLLGYSAMHSVLVVNDFWQEVHPDMKALNFEDFKKFYNKLIFIDKVLSSVVTYLKIL